MNRLNETVHLYIHNIFRFCENWFRTVSHRWRHVLNGDFHEYQHTRDLNLDLTKLRLDWLDWLSPIMHCAFNGAFPFELWWLCFNTEPSELDWLQVYMTNWWKFVLMTEASLCPYRTMQTAANQIKIGFKIKRNIVIHKLELWLLLSQCGPPFWTVN